MSKATSAAVRELTVRAERAEAALSAARQSRELNDQLLRHMTGPVRRFLDVYAWALMATDPVKGRSLDPGSARAFPFDEAPPHLAHESLRTRIKAVERLAGNAADSLLAALGDEVYHADPRDICESCGQITERRPRLRAAQDWLAELVATSRIESSEGMKAALKAGHRQRTIERALRHKRSPVYSYQESGRWWWASNEKGIG